jgi:hypothetical protein
MSLREKWADARERDRQRRETDEARMRRYGKVEELRRLGVPAGPRQSPLALHDRL